MTPLQRARIERNMEYHQKVADHHEGLLKAEGDPLPEQEQADIEAIAEMHGEAAQMLRDMLGSVVDLDIAGAREARVNDLLSRPVGPIRTRTRLQ